MNKFLLSIESSNTQYNCCYQQEGLIRITNDPNQKPVIIEIQRVRNPERGFKMKFNGKYCKRYNQGPIIPADDENDADIFIYDYETKLLKIWRKNDQYICLFRDNVLLAFPIIQIMWKELPCTRYSSTIFYFQVRQTNQIQRGRNALFLVPQSIPNNWNDIRREGNQGKETLIWVEKVKHTKQVTSTNEHGDEVQTTTFVYVDRLWYIDDSKSHYVEMTTKAENSRKFLIKNNVIYTKNNNHLVPLVAGEQLESGIVVDIPDTFFNFHPL